MNRTFSPSYLINPDLRFQVDYPLEFPRIGGWKTQKPAEALWAVGGKVDQNYAIVMNVEIMETTYRGRDSDQSGEVPAPKLPSLRG